MNIYSNWEKNQYVNEIFAKHNKNSEEKKIEMHKMLQINKTKEPKPPSELIFMPEIAHTKIIIYIQSSKLLREREWASSAERVGIHTNTHTQLTGTCERNAEPTES